ncbi:MAG: restriction endonuclease subunit S domain-containing protein [Gemmatimonadaceae bacterium]
MSLFIIRPANDMDAGYLAWYLNQAPAQTSIDQIRTGAGAPIVQRSAFAQIEILLPPLDVQRKIAELGTLLAREQELMGRLTDMVTRSHVAIGQQLIIQMRPGDSAQEKGR